ncbi:HD domain-containing phosphohydrolase [Hyphomicrobium sp. ghe19]|uniref:HD domain-containing phosphohydrolase n=1 Tax=Hyphomicrobium sp. ghe19 TaxID=2682968 RepID=UPI0030CDFC19
MNILIVDDSRANLAFMSDFVRAVGATPLTYADPARALADAPNLDVDLFLVDYNMPQMDGLEVIAALRNALWSAGIPIVMITASEETPVRHRALELGATDFLQRPFDHIDAKSRLRNLLKLREAQKKLKDRAAWLAAEVESATQLIVKREEEIILRLARAAEFRDNDTGAHILRMARYSFIIAKSLGLDSELCRIIYRAAPMHDVGKIGVSDAVLLKPAALSAEERALMEKHTLFGEEILAGSGSRLIQVASEIAGSHHERWDGCGYPRGLKGAEIPIVGRIAAVADVFDALTSERPYKRAWSLEEARAAIVKGSSSQFDPDCVDAFVRRWDAIVEVYREAVSRQETPMSQAPLEPAPAA